jgi:hypothetical protein
VINKIIIGLLIICALGLSGTAAYYSVIGLSTIFIGIVIPVTVMAIFIESSKVLIATVLHQYWEKLSLLLRTGLIVSLLISMGITSIGIYGLLNSGYNVTAIKLEIIESKTEFNNSKISNFKSQLEDLKTEKNQLEENNTQINKGLSDNKIQYTDKNGNIVITQSNANRKTLENQALKIQERKDIINSKIDALNDSVNNYNLLNLQLNTNSDIAAEVGPLKYLSKLFNTSIDRVINWFIIALMLVFDPLAIMLVLTVSSITKNKYTPFTPLNSLIKEDSQDPNDKPISRDLWNIQHFILYLEKINELNKFKIEIGYKIPLLVLSDMGFDKPFLYQLIHNTNHGQGRLIIEDIYCVIEK